MLEIDAMLLELHLCFQSLALAFNSLAFNSIALNLLLSLLLCCLSTTAGETGSCFGSHHEEEVAVKEGAGAAGTAVEEA